MSVTTNQPRGMNLPGTKPPIVPVTHDNVRDWWALLVNRKAYTRQSANPHPETSRHYHYQPKNKDSGQPLELDPPTVRKHLAGWITVGLYAINPQSQRCKWITIDADYDDAFFDLGKLKGELALDGVSAALEMSRRGGHLWIFGERPLLAEQCRVYIYNVALRLGVPIKGAQPVCGTESRYFPDKTDSLPGNSAMPCVVHSESIVPTTTATGFTTPAAISTYN